MVEKRDGESELGPETTGSIFWFLRRTFWDCVEKSLARNCEYGVVVIARCVPATLLRGIRKANLDAADAMFLNANNEHNREDRPKLSIREEEQPKTKRMKRKEKGKKSKCNNQLNLS